jgi:4-hydroxy-2-oxoheptanedioate aldolase
VLVEAPVNGTDAANVRFNAWQFRQILGRGAHGILLCQAESADAVRAFVEACRYPFQSAGVDTTLPSPLERLRGAQRRATPHPLGIGTRGRGSESTASPIWGLTADEYIQRCDPWPLNPAGELLLGVKLESPEGVANCEAILDVPGLAFAEMGPGDLSLALGYTTIPWNPFPPEMLEARNRILGACRERGLAFLEVCNPDNIVARIDEGVRIVAGQREDTARAGRAYQKRTLPA